MRNKQRNSRVAVLIDSSEQPYKSVHCNGEATVASEPASVEEIGRLFERYLGGRDAANDYGRPLVAGGTRVNIRVRPQRQRRIDFGKLEG